MNDLRIEPLGNGYIAQINGIAQYFNDFVDAALWVDEQLSDKNTNYPNRIEKQS